MGKKRKRSDQHVTDLESFKDKHPGGCLNAHHSKYSEGNTCSYRWQAYVKASGSDKARYTWPSDYGLQPPKPKAWDAGQPGNFQEKSTVPYWHESHHIVPHAELSNAIAAIGKEAPNGAEITAIVREGLLDEGYKLNDKENMIILPMLSIHARAVALPKHRMTPTTFHHAAYSKLVSIELEKIFRPMTKSVDPKKHDSKPDYVASAAKIARLSSKLDRGIKDAGALMKQGKMSGDALDDIPAQVLLKK
jgi:hypothetical protein